MKLIVFDFDSTLMDGETIEFLAEPLGLREKVAEITRRAMEGELDFFESLVERVALLEGLPVEKVDNICHSLPLMPGAKETVGQLKGAGYKVLCFSGGFRNATAYFREVLGLDADFANTLHSKNGVLTGKVGGEMMFGNSKGELLARLQRVAGISPEETVVVGDGANDLSMFQYGGVKIAFRGKPILKAAADYTVEEKDLRGVLEILAKIGRL